MLYIEDFLELIEPFPQEIRERLTEMREIDLQIQNETDKLDDKIQMFFHQCKRQKADWKNENYEEIRREYLKLLENADDKVQIANQLYDLIEKYLKKLDQELQKFKLELEADHAGITSKLEQVISSSTNLTETSPLSSSLTTNLNIGNVSAGAAVVNAAAAALNIDDSDFTLNTSTNNDLMMMMYENNTNTNHVTSAHKRKHSSVQPQQPINDEDSSSSWNSKLESSNQMKTTFHFSSNKKISSLISNTSSYQNTNNKKGICFSQSRPDSNLIKLIRTNNTNNNQSLNTSTSSTSNTNRRTSSSTTPKAQANTTQSSKKQRKKKISDLDYEDDSKYDDYELKNELDDNDYTDDLNEEASETATSENDVFNPSGRGVLNDDYYDSDQSSELDQNEDTTSDELENKIKLNKRANQQQNRSSFKDDWNSGEDTNQRYCICKDFSYGDMIMCDNSKCETQWFHFVCVGLNSAPKGKWFCPSCVESKKKKKEKLTISSMSGISNNTAQSSASSSSFISVNAASTNFNSTNKPTNDSHQSANPFLSSSSSFSINYNDKNF